MCHVVLSEPCLFSHLHTGSLQQMELKESRQQTFGWPLVGHMEACTCTAEAKRKKMKCINKKGVFFLYPKTVGINNLIMRSVKNIKHLCF